MTGSSAMFKFLKPSMRPQLTDIQGAVGWGVAAATAGLYLVQVFFSSHFYLLCIICCFFKFRNILCVVRLNKLHLRWSIMGLDLICLNWFDAWLWNCSFQSGICKFGRKKKVDWALEKYYKNISYPNSMKGLTGCWGFRCTRPFIVSGFFQLTLLKGS